MAAVLLFAAGTVLGLGIGFVALREDGANIALEAEKAPLRGPVRAYAVPSPREEPRRSPPSAGKPANPQPVSPQAVVPSRPPARIPPWRANAVPTNGAEKGRPVIALVIDDMGIDQKRSRRAIDLPPPLTLAFIPYGYNLRQLTAIARAAGHELLVHMPMEPTDLEADPGPNALLTTLPPEELLRRLRWGLARFDGYVGLSNHMGSRYSAWPAGMRLVLKELRERGLLFLDSLTIGETVGVELARKMGLPYAARDVFLDNDATPEAVRRQLALLEKIARQSGSAIGIGHPHDATIDVLERWLLEVRQRGFVLVPVSALVRLPSVRS